MPLRALLILGLMAAHPACSDSAETPQAPGNSAAAPTAREVTPGQSHLAQTYGISDEEAQRRLAAQEHVSALARNLRLGRVAGFSEIWIEHEPRYAIVLAFKRPPDEAAILSRAHSSIRGDIVFRSAKRTRAEIERDGDRIVAAFRGAPGTWAGGYDVKTEKFEFDFATQAGLAFAERNVPPDLKDDVIVRIGSVPVPLAR